MPVTVLLATVLFGAAGFRAVAAPPPAPLAFQAVEGYRAAALGLMGAAVAVSPGGRAAVAQDAADGGATIALYDRLEAADRKLLQTIKAPAGDTFKFFGGLVFKDDDTLFFSENGAMNTVYRASAGTGEAQALLPKAGLPNAADVAIRRSDGVLFVLVTPGPGQGAVYTVSGGQAALFAKGLGIGYVTGLAFSPTERLFVGDTADPTFAGKPGQILELGEDGAVAQAIPLAAGGGTGLGGLAIDAEGDLFASTGATITEVRLHRGAQVSEFGRFSGMGPFPGELLFRGSRFEPASGDGRLVVDGGFTDVGGLFEVTTTAEKPFLPGDFATSVVAFNGTNGKTGFNLTPEAALGPPSAAATPMAPDNRDIVSFGWGGSITLAFDRPILHDPLHPGGCDFIVYGNSFYVGGDPHVTFQGPGYVEVGLDLNGNGMPDPGEPFYLLRGRPDPGTQPQWPLPASLYGVVDHRQTPMLGYADVTPTDGSGDPLLPNSMDPMMGGLTPGSAGGDGFDLSWAVDAQGHPVNLDRADFVRITHALNATNPLFGRSTTQVDAVSLVRPLPRYTGGERMRKGEMRGTRRHEGHEEATNVRVKAREAADAFCLLPTIPSFLSLHGRFVSSSCPSCLRVHPAFHPLHSVRRAFTLVELLVVMGVMAMLAAVLFPALAGAREKGRQAVCAANLRQLALANQMYAQDNDGCFSPAAQGYIERDDRRWFGVRGTDGRFEPRDGPLVPYLREGGALRRCPSFRSTVGFDQGTGGFVYNYLAVGGRVWRLGYVPEAFDQGMSEAELPRPAEIAMFADGALDIGTGLAEYGFMDPPPAVAARIPGASVLDPAIHFRHQEHADVVFVDGHIRALTRVLSVERSPVYPGAAPAARGLGWFGPVVGKTFYVPE